MHDDPIRIDPPLYLAHTRMSCWRCGADVPAIALVAPNVAETEGEICLLSEVEELPESVLQFVRKRFPSFKLTYSKTLGLRYYANTCPRCGVIFGDFYLHSEPGAPFFPTTEDEAKELTLEPVPLTGSITVRSGLAMGVGDLILEHARKLTGGEPAATGSGRHGSR
jgi:ribosomal protein S27AE